MKKSIWYYLALSLILALGSAAPAAAQDLSSFYLAPKIISSSQKAEFNGGGSEKSSILGLGLAMGTDLSYASSLPLRVELEYLYHGSETYRNGTYSHEVSAHSLMANAFLDIQTDTAFTPYLGGGLGLGYLKDRYTIGVSSTATRWNFAWNLGGGVAWGLNENLALDFGYRYMDLGKTDSVVNGGGVHNVSLTAHELGIGLRIMAF